MGDTPIAAEPIRSANAAGWCRQFPVRWLILAAGTAILLAGTAVAVDADSRDAASDCPYGDVTILSARGSGEELDLDGNGQGNQTAEERAGRYGLAVHGAVTARLADRDIVVGLESIDYPAIPADFWDPGYFGDAGYPLSVNRGVDAAEDALRSIADDERCGSNHAVVLVGYSQGAHVLQLLLERIEGTRLEGLPAAIGFFANPMFTWDDESARGTFPPYASGTASYFVGDFAPAPVRPSYAAATRTWCLRGDPVCDASIANSDTVYVHTGKLYGVGLKGEPLGYGALLDVVNTAIDGLNRRGVSTGELGGGSLIGTPRVEELARDRSGNSIAATLWISLAPILGDNASLTAYRWDLDSDGDFEIAGATPAIQFPVAAQAGTPELAVRVAADGTRVSREYELCWELESSTRCGADDFVDIAGSVFQTDIVWLAENGITSGCNPPQNDEFCPGNPVTRGQMAAFLVRAIGLVDEGHQGFTDVGGSVFETDIAKLAAAGITQGCNPPANDRYCPHQTVTRGQMAAFLARAVGLTETGSKVFVDVAGSVFETDIAKLAAAGITQGCNPPANDRYCPHQTVTRGQMAAFLHRTLGA